MLGRFGGRCGENWTQFNRARTRHVAAFSLGRGEDVPALRCLGSPPLPPTALSLPLLGLLSISVV